MTYYTESRRTDIVIDVLRRNGPMRQRDLLERLDRQDRVMNRNTAWKAVQCLCDEGVLEKSEGFTNTKAKFITIFLDWWYEMTEEQRERTVRAWESIAESMRIQTEIMQSQAKPQRETKTIKPKETKEAGKA